MDLIDCYLILQKNTFFFPNPKLNKFACVEERQDCGLRSKSKKKLLKMRKEEGNL